VAKPIWIEIVCRGCSASVSGRFTMDKIPRKDMERDAALKGWRYAWPKGDASHRDWFCPKCRPHHH